MFPVQTFLCLWILDFDLNYISESDFYFFHCKCIKKKKKNLICESGMLLFFFSGLQLKHGSRCGMRPVCHVHENGLF